MRKKVFFIFLAIVVLLSIIALYFRFNVVPLESSVPLEMRSCNVDSDCTYVETRCDFCCGFVGINKNFKENYEKELYSWTCKYHNGPVCDCIGPTEPYCLDGICELKPIEKK